MELWSRRSGIYKVTLLLIYFIFLVYALAFSIPAWFGPSVDKYFVGLWMICTGTDLADIGDNCEKNAFGADSDWMDGVRGVWVAGMFFFLMGVIYSCVENCCSEPESKDYGLTGTLTLLAGMCGAAGVIVVAIKLEDLSGNYDYYWGYILACIASGLAMILAIVLLITRNTRVKEKSHNARTADYVFAHKQGHPYTTEYINQGYNRDDIPPLANGVTYHHTPTAPHPYTMYQGQGSYHSNSLPHPRNQGSMYGQSQGYGHPGGYSPYDMGRSNQRHSWAESADLSNGYTTELIQAEHTLSRSNVGNRGDLARGSDYVRNEFAGRNDYYLNGSGRPY